MWYFTWILGLGFALAAGVISVMWLETTYALGGLDKGKIEDRFGKTGGGQS
jgi:cyd operon protein YbgT